MTTKIAVTFIASAAFIATLTAPRNAAAWWYVEREAASACQLMTTNPNVAGPYVFDHNSDGNIEGSHRSHPRAGIRGDGRPTSEARGGVLDPVFRARARVLGRAIRERGAA